MRCSAFESMAIFQISASNPATWTALDKALKYGHQAAAVDVGLKEITAELVSVVKLSRQCTAAGFLFLNAGFVKTVQAAIVL
jgi:hypothetical protein